jgi:hypothetical protein
MGVPITVSLDAFRGVVLWMVKMMALRAPRGRPAKPPRSPKDSPQSFPGLAAWPSAPLSSAQAVKVGPPPGPLLSVRPHVGIADHSAAGAARTEGRHRRVIRPLIDRNRCLMVTEQAVHRERAHAGSPACCRGRRWAVVSASGACAELRPLAAVQPARSRASKIDLPYARPLPPAPGQKLHALTEQPPARVSAPPRRGYGS